MSIERTRGTPPTGAEGVAAPSDSSSSSDRASPAAALLGTPSDALAGLDDAALERATGSPRLDRNALELQFDGPSTFETWLEAIEGARSFIHFENYILRDDRVGRRFREALVERARAGVEVRVLYDWVGCWATPRRFWRPFREAGVEVRAFNRPSLRDPYGVLQRDHRKLVVVDGCTAFVGGFCIGDEWAGGGQAPPWRDTGVAICGPAAAAATRAFERAWAEMGTGTEAPLACEPLPEGPGGTVPVWLIEGEPGRTRVLRTLALIAAHARHRLWITDPYFVAPRLLSEALAEAARHGVDVRVLVPANNNWPLVGSLSRSGYRFLLEAGVRLFEWQGPMIHAKTSVADGVWSRVGSSNLNSASLLGNWEIDVGVWDAPFARQLEGLFLADLASSVEIVLPRARAPGPGSGERRLPAASAAALAVEAESRRLGLGVDEQGAAVPLGEAAARTPLDPQGRWSERLEALLRESTASAVAGGSSGWGMAQLVRASTSLGVALAGRRTLGPEDRAVLGTVATAILVLALLTALFPTVVGMGIAVLLGWLGIVTGARAWAHRRRARAELSVRDPGGASEEDA
ncbi:MAG: cardiolipin synthase B [Gemmatimonadetes bacterium]|nr:MAG: cardiolipin synthase B [Gemmatimonadota bacterium]